MSTLLRAALPCRAERFFRNVLGAGPAALVLALTMGCLGCSALTPPPRFSRLSPADEDAPEAASPLPVPLLSRQPESEASAPPPPQSDPHAGHEGHGGPAAPAERPESAAYTCPHHPEVEAQAAGSCPKCGTRLVRKPATEPGR